jgi:hypothetical protein
MIHIRLNCPSLEVTCHVVCQIWLCAGTDLQWGNWWNIVRYENIWNFWHGCRSVKEIVMELGVR